jgi:uncharacterized membrane protein
LNIRISEIKRKSKQTLKGNWGNVLLLTFILFLINVVLPTIIEIVMSGGFTTWIDQEHTPLGVNIVSTIISIALLPLSVTVYWYYLSLVRKDNPQISQVFSVYKDGKTSLRLIGISILQALFVFLWSFLLVIPGIIKALAYSQTYYLLRDHPEYTVLEAITESRKRMKGYKRKYFLLGLSFIGWGILCLFTLGIGLLWLFPYIATSNATFYNELIYPQNKVFEDKEVII